MEPVMEPIDRLNSQLGVVLTLIGRIFRDASRADNKGLGRARGQEVRMDVISKANTKFHEALDEIEIEIVQAKSVMERDLNRIRSAREAEKAQGMPLPDSALLPDGLGPGGIDLSGDAFADGLLDHIPGINGTNSAHDLGTAISMDPSATAAGGDASKAVATDGQSSTQPGDGTQGGDIKASSADPSADPNAAFDFDSLFTDAGTSTAFDLDFSGGPSAPNGAAATVTADASLDDIFDNMGASTDDFTDLGNVVNGGGTDGGHADATGPGPITGGGTADDIEALLPGLGSYVNAEGGGDLGGPAGDDDFAMIDLPTDALDLGGDHTGQSQEPKQDGSNAAGGQEAALSANIGGDGGDAGGEQSNHQDANNGGLGEMDDIFGDMDVGNMDGANLDDFDWGM